jgi:replicative DNA helicase
MIRVPEDPESERALLSTLCAAGMDESAPEYASMLREDDFIHPAHRCVLRALRTVLDARDELSLLSLSDALSRAKELQRVGGHAGLVEILSAEQVARPEVLIRILQRLRRRRELIRLGAHIATQAESDESDPEKIIEEAGAQLSAAVTQQGYSGIRPMADLSDSALARIRDQMDGVDHQATWLKGWSRLNKQLGGLLPGQLVTLAARPGIGKSALALNWCLAATEYRKAVGIFNLEMSAEALWQRLCAAHAGVDVREMIANKDWTDFNRLGDAKVELDQRGIWIQDKAGITARQIQGECDSLIARQPNLGLLIVDHLGLISSPGDSRQKTETVRIGEITRALKVLAKDRKIPVLMLVQMNRDIEKRGSAARPQLADLRDSGCIEQDSDVVMFIHRRMDQTDSELIIAKQREGPVGTINLTYDPKYTRYSETERSTPTRFEPDRQLMEDLV